MKKLALLGLMFGLTMGAVYTHANGRYHVYRASEAQMVLDSDIDPAGYMASLFTDAARPDSAAGPWKVYYGGQWNEQDAAVLRFECYTAPVCATPAACGGDSLLRVGEACQTVCADGQMVDGPHLHTCTATGAMQSPEGAVCQPGCARVQLRGVSRTLDGPYNFTRDGDRPHYVHEPSGAAVLYDAGASWVLSSGLAAAGAYRQWFSDAAHPADLLHDAAAPLGASTTLACLVEPPSCAAVLATSPRGVPGVGPGGGLFVHKPALASPVPSLGGAGLKGLGAQVFEFANDNAYAEPLYLYQRKVGVWVLDREIAGSEDESALAIVYDHLPMLAEPPSAVAGARLQMRCAGSCGPVPTRRNETNVTSTCEEQER